MRVAILLLVICAISFAQFEELIDAHQAAAKNEDWDAYVATLDTSEMNSSEIEGTRNVVEAVWERYDTDYYQVSNVSSIEQGEDALVQYHLNANISGAEEAQVDEEYIALLHKAGEEWKIVYTMPLADYLEITEGMQKVKEADAISEVIEEKEAQASQEPAKTEQTQEETAPEQSCLPAFLLFASLAILAAKK